MAFKLIDGNGNEVKLIRADGDEVDLNQLVNSHAPPILSQHLQKALRASQKDGNSEYLQGRRDALRELYESGGLPESQLGLEILYLLPDAFVRFYQDLFHKAMLGGKGGNVSGMGGQGEGIEKAKGKASGLQTRDSGLQASTTGKRWRNNDAGAAGVGNDRAFAVKEAIDKELRILTDLGEYNLRSKGEKGTLPDRCRGKVPGRNGDLKGCGRFMRREWKHCPTCGTAR